MQFDVFVNPIAAMRHAYPFVVDLQADFIQTYSDQIVAPLVPRRSLSTIAGRVMPLVTLDSRQYVVLAPALTGVRRRDLGQRVGSLVEARNDLLAAIDYLFFGV
jgi:toxin CcdB